MQQATAFELAELSRGTASVVFRQGQSNFIRVPEDWEDLPLQDARTIFEEIRCGKIRPEEVVNKTHKEVYLPLDQAYYH